MALSVIAAWLVGARSAKRREHGFWWFLGSNVLWIIWALHDGAYALLALQLCLATLNIRGVRKNEQGPDAIATKGEAGSKAS